MKPTNQNLWTPCEGKIGPGKGDAPATAIPAMGLNDNLVFMGKELHVQTENQGSSALCILTQVFLNGRVVFSTKSEIPHDFHEMHEYSKIQDLMHTQHSQVIQKIKDKQTWENPSIG
jgi:hypothetical protein